MSGIAVSIDECYSKLPWCTYEYYDTFSSPSLLILLDSCLYEPEHIQIVKEILEERGDFQHAF